MKQQLSNKCDSVFMTTNQDINEIEKQLQMASKKDRNIKVNYEIDTSVNFLRVQQSSMKATARK